MSKIKFRAWDSKKKVWTNYQIVDDMIYFMDKFTGVWLRDDDFKRFKLAQYAGSNDKRGKEIYDGYIIRFIDRNCLVVWSEKDCAFRIDVDRRITTALRKVHQPDYEIIGNIYENPELLEENYEIN